MLTCQFRPDPTRTPSFFIQMPNTTISAYATQSQSHRLWQTSLAWTLLLGYLISLALNFPGHFSMDSVFQLAEGVQGKSMSFNPPIMSALLGAYYKLNVTAAFMMTSSAAFYLGTYLLLRGYNPRYRIVVLAVIIVVSLSPLVLIYNGTVWKDVFFANVALLGFGLASHIRSRRSLALLVAVVLFAAATLIRQQGIIVATAGCLYIAVRLCWPQKKQALVNFLALMMGLLATTAALQFISNQVITPRATGGLSVGLGVLASYDIAAVASRSPVAMEALSGSYGINGRALIDASAKEYSPERVDYLNKTFQSLAPLQANKRILSLWGASIVSEPGAWIGHRWSTWQALLTLNHAGGRCLPMHVGIATDAVPALQATGQPVPDAAVFLPAETQAKSFLYRYAMDNLYWFAGGIWFLLGIVVCGVSAYRRDVLTTILSASGLTFTASYLLVGIACDFRYQYFGVLSTIVGMLMLAASFNRPRGDVTATAV